MSTDALLGAFLATFGATGVALGVAIYLGLRGRTRQHVIAIAVFVAGFGATVALAEAVGRRFVLDPFATGVHLPIAFLGTFGLALPLVSGWRVLRGTGSIIAHRAAVAWWLTVFVCAAVTGANMLLTGTRR